MKNILATLMICLLMSVSASANVLGDVKDYSDKALDGMKSGYEAVKKEFEKSEAALKKSVAEAEDAIKKLTKELASIVSEKEKEAKQHLIEMKTKISSEIQDKLKMVGELQGKIKELNDAIDSCKSSKGRLALLEGLEKELAEADSKVQQAVQDEVAKAAEIARKATIDTGIALKDLSSDALSRLASVLKMTQPLIIRKAWFQTALHANLQGKLPELGLDVDVAGVAHHLVTPSVQTINLEVLALSLGRDVLKLICLIK